MQSLPTIRRPALPVLNPDLVRRYQEQQARASALVAGVARAVSHIGRGDAEDDEPQEPSAPAAPLPRLREDLQAATPQTVVGKQQAPGQTNPPPPVGQADDAQAGTTQPLPVARPLPVLRDDSPRSRARGILSRLLPSLSPRRRTRSRSPSCSASRPAPSSLPRRGVTSAPRLRPSTRRVRPSPSLSTTTPARSAPTSRTMTARFRCSATRKTGTGAAGLR